MEPTLFHKLFASGSGDAFNRMIPEMAKIAADNLDWVLVGVLHQLSSGGNLLGVSHMFGKIWLVYKQELEPFHWFLIGAGRNSITPADVAALLALVDYGGWDLVSVRGETHFRFPSADDLYVVGLSGVRPTDTREP